ncbi:hypothetical protein RB653_003366 [Dictyostelium firmibasis]|uniref:Uncharacterized protein n=1 Tax=Dictyostelium firmibasis TaxID=79012 RepID=A0AAN7U7Y0_9MYCE
MGYTNTSTKMTTSFDSMFKFSNNNKILLSMIPLILLFLYIGGKNTIYISTMMIFLIYISEYLNSPPLTLISIWVGIFLANLSILFQGLILVQHSIINFILLMNIMMSMGLMGIWLTLQFSWFTSKYSVVATLMERVLFGNLMFPTSTLLTWCTVVVNGIEASPFYLIGFLFIYYFIYGLPQRSFKVRSSKQVLSTNDFILGRLDTGLMAITVIFFPPLLYYSIYHYVFFQSMDHIVNILLLLSSSGVYLFILSKYGSLWWLLPNYWDQRLNIKKYDSGNSSNSNSNSNSNSISNSNSNSILNKSYSFIFGIGSTVKIICMLVLVGCLEYRVLFNSVTFYSAVQNLSPRWGFIVVTIGLYSFSTIFYFIFMGVESTFSNNTVTTIPTYYQYVLSFIASLFSISISLILSTPIYIYPFSILASLSIINFLFKKRSISFLIFIVSSCIFLIWFINRNYLFINYEFINSYPVSNLSLKTICIMIVILFILSLLMVYTIGHQVFPTVTISQSILLTSLEISLHSTKYSIYPTYLIVVSSLLIIYLNTRLMENNSITNNIGMISNSLMISKLFGLVFTPLNENILACFMFTVLIYWIYKPPTFTTTSTPTAGGTNSNGVSVGNVNITHSLMNKNLLYLQIGLAALVSFTFNKQITIRLLNLFLDTSDSENNNNSVIFIASFLLTFGISIIPICFRSISPLKRFKNLNVLILFTSFLLLILNQSTINSLNKSNLLWTNWFLLFSLIIIIIGFGKRVSISKSSKLKLLFSIGFGSGIGIYVCLNYFLKNSSSINPSSYYYKKVVGDYSNEESIGMVDILLNLGFVSLFSMVSYFIAEAQWPSISSSGKNSGSSMEAIYIMITVIFNCLYYLLGKKYSTLRSQSILETTSLSLIGLFVGINLLIAIYLKFHTKLSVQHQLSTKTKSQYNYYQSPIKKANHSSTNNNNLNQQHESNSFLQLNSWIYTIGNWCCLISYGLSIYIGYLMNYSEKAVFILSPILLLLVTDKGWLKKILNQSHRYFPMVFSLSVFLAVTSLLILTINSPTINIITKSSWLFKYVGLASSNSLIKIWWSLKNWLFFIWILPSIYNLNLYLYKQNEKLNVGSSRSASNNKIKLSFSLFYFLPTSIISSLFSDIVSIQLLSLITLIGLTIQRYKILKIENKGNQLI